ncbi:ANTAR domain-containing protein [Actinoplanes sp. KI2]|uniref:ANTAR domain-containing protein n=1 Tax=Actinoplanes sp. KI2 TaxID=2983315 RepID=UPI0021D60BD3|nr:ANTAR domain-containing protein [Actinoplanes sp. KI2]MCU7730301.1 ANTAR domain-containing protein [Actinoplanes sp. KI2]
MSRASQDNTVVAGARSRHLPPATVLARLNQELDGLRRARRSRSVIEQAKGVLMGRLGCSADQAFEQLTRISQQTNTKVAEVAAGLLGLTAPAAPATVPDQESARYHLACAAMAAAPHADAVAEALLTEGLRPLGAAGVLLARREADGTVRLVGSYGVPRGLVSAWQRLPSGLHVGFLAAVAEGRPLWLTRDEADRAGLDLLGTYPFRACLPLRRGDRVVGVAVAVWPEDPGRDLPGRALVTALTAAAGRRLRQLAADERVPVAAPAAHWLDAVLEALAGSFALLSPVTDESGAIVDWRFDKCSPQARDAMGRPAEQLVGRRLLALQPHLAGGDILRGYQDVLRTGRPFTHGPAREPLAGPGRGAGTTIWIRAARLGDGILVTWRHDDRRTAVLERLRLLQEVTGAPADGPPPPEAAPGRSPTASDDASALADTLRHLTGKVERLRHEQQVQALVDRAKGLLSARLGCSIEAALEHLGAVARQRRVSLLEAAAAAVGAVLPAGPPPASADEDFHPEIYLGAAHPSGQPFLAAVEPGEQVLAELRGATDGDGVASILWAAGLRRLGAHAVVLGVLEPDGAVRLAGSYGLPADLIGTWRRTPSSLNVPYLRAVATDQPLWITRREAAAHGYQLLGAGERRACLPLHEAGRIFGVASILWPEPARLDDRTRTEVTALAEAAGRRLSELLRAAPHGSAASPAAHWAEIVVGALPPCYALLRPVRDRAGEVTDWRFEICSPGTVDVAGRTPDEIVGRHLHELYPHVLTTGIADGYRAAMRSGTSAGWGPAEFDIETASGPVPVTMSGRAARFGDGLLVHWRRERDDDLDRRVRQLEEATGTGWAEWDLAGGDAVWSAAVYDLLRRDPRRGPVKLGALRRYVDPKDETLMIDAVRRLTRLKHPVDVVVPLRRNGTVTPIRFAARPSLDGQGRVAVVRAVFQRLGD